MMLNDLDFLFHRFRAYPKKFEAFPSRFDAAP